MTISVTFALHLVLTLPQKVFEIPSGLELGIFKVYWAVHRT